MRFSCIGSLMLAAAFVLFSASSFVQGAAYAQDLASGTISGTVADSTGALLPGVAVRTTQTATNVGVETGRVSGVGEQKFSAGGMRQVVQIITN